MRYKKIVGFGDSWVYGDELLDPQLKQLDPPAHTSLVENTAYREQQCFLGCLGRHYNLPIENFGIPGGSLQSTVWNYIWWTQHETLPLDQCIVLVGLTDAGRMSFYNPDHVVYDNDREWNRYVHSTWIHAPECYTPGWEDTVKHVFALSDSPELRQLNYYQTVMFFAGQAHINSNLLQFNTINSALTYSTPSLICPNSNLVSLLKNQPNYADLIATDLHPNENGHKLIAQHLINHIDSCIINGC